MKISPNETETDMENALTKNTADMGLLEGIIEKNLQSFYEVGKALAEIRDRELYRDVLGYDTFEAYCKDRWDFSRSYAYRLIGSANVVDVVSPIGDIHPTTESQTRPIAKLSAPQQRIAWQKAVETAPEGKVTASHVYKIVKEMTSDEPKERQPIPKDLVSPEFQSAFDNMVIEIKNARAMKWRTTAHKQAIEMMGILLNIAKQ